MTGLVLSAGGMFAAWEVGVWKVLQPRIQIDLVVGASAGAWVGWAIAGGCSAEELEAEWLDPRTASIMQPGLHRSGILRPDAMHAKARELFSRYRPRLPFGLTVMEIAKFETRLVRDSEITWQHLAATASVPLCFPPVRIQGKRYVDGGFPANALPVWAAEQMGATRAVAVLCLNTLPFRLLRRVLPPRKSSSSLPVNRLAPSEDLGSLRDAITWNPANVKRWIALGERDATRALLSITM